MKLDQRYQVLPDMNEEQFQALKADIAERGVLTPIDVDEEGYILDGHHRYRACVELEITDFPTIIRLDLSESEKRMFARKSNMLRRHLTQEQMRLIIADQLRDTPEWANNRIGQELGVDSKTVSTMREKMESTSEIPKLTKLIGADGKERPVNQKRKPSIMAANEAEYNECMDNLASELARLTGQTFMSVRQGMIVIHDNSYDAYAGLTDDEKKEWDTFYIFLVKKCHGTDCGQHIEWLRARSFRTPTEWLGEEGAHWRKIWMMREPKAKFQKAWALFWQEKKEQTWKAIGEEIKRMPVPLW